MWRLTPKAPKEAECLATKEKRRWIVDFKGSWSYGLWFRPFTSHESEGQALAAFLGFRVYGLGLSPPTRAKGKPWLPF
jgi:hypothetical protein